MQPCGAVACGMCRGSSHSPTRPSLETDMLPELASEMFSAIAHSCGSGATLAGIRQAEHGRFNSNGSGKGCTGLYV
ncbi:hypothetical protein HaLaN_20415 [Haematococcus lacustris]|uniref:Uncharacterized protein n=1 Tax=Haematococcus lacustris TaxID=44745 RepID=A0A699ZJD8_HAELA|nr:hypothetical protein HaLaN_20415 [Haematococcus lacustris]